jgi:guanylate kinase
MPKKQGKVFIIAAPTGCGESAVTKAVLSRLPRTERMITATTRSARPHEKNGRDYFFVSPAKFKLMVGRGEFLEYIKVPNRNVYYGTIKKQIENKLARGINLIGNLEKRGLKSYRQAFPPHQVLGIFIKPDSLKVLRKRFILRDPTISKTEIAKRINNARKEMREEKYYDYTVANPDGRINVAVDKTLKILKNFIKKNRF